MPSPLADPKLLQLFDELVQTRSVTRAAANLGQEQPTVSIWLAKLRARFGDPLFVRTAGGMQPTPRAEGLIEPVRRALAGLREVDSDAPGFDPSTTQRRFRVCMTDASHVTLLPRLLTHVRAGAPGLSLDAGYIGPDIARELEAGIADLAIGYLPKLGPGFYQQSLFTQDFVCLVSARHPRVHGKLTLRQYEHEAHVGLTLSGTAQVDEAMAKRRVRRRVQVRLPGYLGLAGAIAATDLVATVPRQIGRVLVTQAAIRLSDCPVPIPAYAVRQHWHARFHNDPGHQWLRAACAALFGEKRSGKPAA